MQSINLPFWLAAICSAFPLVFIQVWVTRSVAASEGKCRYLVSLRSAARQSIIVVYAFGISGLLCGGAFASCISQYVMVVADSGFAEKVVAVVLPVNAVIVVSLQYAVGRRLTAVNIRPMMTTGTVFLSPGSSDLFFRRQSVFGAFSGSIYDWRNYLCPGEYMLIDNIAPAGMKASYFSAQSLGWLGAAVNPLASGVILTTLPARSLFVVLIIAIVFARALMLKGMRITPTQQAITC